MRKPLWIAVFLVILSAPGPTAHAGEPAVPRSWWKNEPDPLATMFLMAQPVEGQEPDDKDPHPRIDGHPHPVAKREHEPAPTPPGPSIFAGTPLGIGLFVVGIIGWIALGLAFFILERRPAGQSPMNKGQHG